MPPALTRTQSDTIPNAFAFSRRSITGAGAEANTDIMHVNRTILASITIAAGAFLAASCGGSKHNPSERYYLVSTNIKLAYWQAAATGLTNAAKELNVTAEMVGPDTYDPQAERDAFQRAVANNAAGILVSSADPTLMKADIDAAIAKGIPVVSIDSDTPSSKRLLFVGTNNYQVGTMGGRLLIKLLGGKGSVIVYTMPGQANLDERLKGYKDVLADQPGIKIVQMVDIKGDPRIAFDTTNDIVTQGKLKPDAFVCLEAIACKEVADVLDRNQVKGKTVIAMDTDQDTLKWIKQGSVAATIAQKPYTMGYDGLQVLANLHVNKLPDLNHDWATDTRSPLPAFIDTGATLIEKTNVADFEKAQK